MPTTGEPLEIAIAALACARMGWRLEILDPFARHLARVSDGTRSFLTGAGRVSAFPLNQAAAVDVARDKAHTAALLAQAGFRVPRGEHVFLHPEHRTQRPAGREIADAPRLAAGLGWPVFVKPNHGSRGAFAEIVETEAQLLAHLAVIAGRHDMALIQEVLSGPERRLFLLDGVVRFAYRRQPARLAGDGRRSLRALLAEFNAGAGARGVTPVPESSPFLARCLAAAGLRLDDVPAAGREVPFAPRANLAAGGQLHDFVETVPAATAAWAARLAAAVQLRVCAVDLFGDDPGDFVVIEVNGNPSLGGPWAAGHRETVIALWAETARRALAGEAAPWMT